MSLFVDERGPKIRWGHRPTRRHNIHQRSFPVSRIGIGRPDNGHLSGNVFPPVRIAPQIPQHNNRKINECFFFICARICVSIDVCPFLQSSPGKKSIVLQKHNALLGVYRNHLFIHGETKGFSAYSKSYTDNETSIVSN